MLAALMGKSSHKVRNSIMDGNISIKWEYAQSHTSASSYSGTTTMLCCIVKLEEPMKRL